VVIQKCPLSTAGKDKPQDSKYATRSWSSHDSLNRVDEGTEVQGRDKEGVLLLSTNLVERAA
jgi:hypothetical protein